MLKWQIRVRYTWMRALVPCLTYVWDIDCFKIFLGKFANQKKQIWGDSFYLPVLEELISKGNDRKWTVGKQRVEMYYDRFTKIKRSDLGRWFIDNSERFIDPRNEIHNNYFSFNNSCKSKKASRLQGKTYLKIVWQNSSLLWQVATSIGPMISAHFFQEGVTVLPSGLYLLGQFHL